LDIFDNQLTSLDVSNNPVLTLLECYSNQLTSLDVSNNPALTRLECGNNQLTSLDVRSNPALETLSSVGNQLTDLDVRNGNNTDLWFFNASSNPDLTCIFVDDVSYSDANWSNIDPNSYFVENEAECSNPSLLYTAIPDQNFEQALIDTGIANPTINGKVLTANIEVVTGFFIENKNITDLTGIEDFTALTFLDCSENQLTSLDFSNNTALTSFDCANNQLTSIDLSQNAVLTDFSCGNNQLTSIDLSQNPALIQLNCANNQLSSIDVSANNALTNLYCQNNQLSSLDVSNNPALFDLRCIDNQLTSIDVSANPALYILICDSNQLTSLDVSDNNALAALYCYNNQLTSLDVSANPALIELSCDNNQLTSLDVRNGNNTDFWFFNATTNPNLTCIFVDDVSYSFANWTDIDPASTFVENEAECSALYTAIPDPNFEQALIDLGIDTNPTIDGQVLTADIEGVTQLGVSSKNIADLKGIEGFISLTELFCFSNQLTSLDVTNNIALTILDVGDNLLTSLDLSNNIALTELECDENQLTGLLDLSNNIILNILECQVNKIEILNIKNGNNTNVTNFNASTNPDLYCIVVDDISYSTTNWTNIDPASTFVNNETDCELLSIEYNNFELEVAIYPNPTDNYLFIEGNVNPVSITIYNLLGAKVIAKSNTDKIDVSELSKGVYIIKISDGVSQTNKKFVKN